MTKVLKFAAAVGTVAFLAGCPGANLPGGVGMPSTTPSGAAAGPDVALAATCTSNAPAAATSTGSAKHGKYNAQTMPNAWDNLADEAAVTAATDKIKNEGGNTWACFNKFYGGLLTAYYKK